jgi:hypothetical protein
MDEPRHYRSGFENCSRRPHPAASKDYVFTLDHIQAKARGK